MIKTNPQSNEQEIKRYLFAEMTDAERRTIEEQFLHDDELFFSAVNLENELVDLFANNKLEGEDFARFQRSLEQLPERRQKAANAIALQTFIAEERPAVKSAIVAGNQTFRQKLAEFFSFKTPAFGYAMSGLAVVFAVASVVLFLQNGRRSQELARLQTEERQYEQSSRRESELQNQLADLRRNESELQNRVDGEREVSGDLTDELARERQNRRQIESELQRVKQQTNIPRLSLPPSATPAIATILLKPSLNGSGGNRSENLPKLDSTQNTKRVAVQLSLPAETGLDERFSVRLNEKSIARDLKARVGGDGQKSVQLTVSPNDLMDGTNKLTVVNAAGAVIVNYDFTNLKK